MPLSIVQVATAFSGWGPDEWHVLDLARQLKRRGHRVTVACRPDRWIEQQAARMALPSVAFNVLRQQDWQDLGKMVRFFRAGRTDVVHIHAHGDYVIPALAAHLAGVPVRVMTGHNPKKLSSARGAKIYSDVLYTRVIANSHVVREVLIESGMSASRIEVIPYGVETEASPPPARQPNPRGSLSVGLVGRIASDRGHFDLVEAAHRLRGKYPLQYKIIGSGPDGDALRHQVAIRGLSDLFSFTGFRADMDGLIADLDIVVTLASSPHTCCAVVQKAMMLGKPTVASRVGGNKELIVDGETGILIPPRSATKLTAVLAALAEDHALRARMSGAARTRAMTHYAVEHMIDRIDALYRSGLRDPSAVSAVEGLMNPS